MLILAALAAACGGAAAAAREEAPRPGRPRDPAAERAEVQAALDEDIAAQTAEYDRFIVEGKVSRDEVEDAGGSLRHVHCTVSISLSIRETGAMIAFAKSSASVEAPERQVLASRKDCVVAAGRDGLEHFATHFATSSSAFALAAAQSAIRAGALAFN